MEELRTCLPSTAAFPSLLDWLIRGELVRELGGTVAFSEPRLSLEPSLLRLRSEVLLFPAGAGPRTEELGRVAVAAAAEESGFCFC